MILFLKKKKKKDILFREKHLFKIIGVLMIGKPFNSINMLHLFYFLCLFYARNLQT